MMSGYAVSSLLDERLECEGLNVGGYACVVAADDEHVFGVEMCIRDRYVCCPSNSC